MTMEVRWKVFGDREGNVIESFDAKKKDEKVDLRTKLMSKDLNLQFK